MFIDMPTRIKAQMKLLEEIDARDRNDGTSRLQRLRQIPPETGAFIAMIAAGAPDGVWVEIGTSAGYSALWISLACRERQNRLTTFELLPEKVALARETFKAAGIEDVVDLVSGDARHYLAQANGIAFCFLDAEKEIYSDCYEIIIPKMVSGGILVADNAINHRASLQPMLDRALSDNRVDAMVVPIGKGELLCRKC